MLKLTNKQLLYIIDNLTVAAFDSDGQLEELELCDDTYEYVDNEKVDYKGDLISVICFKNRCGDVDDCYFSGTGKVDFGIDTDEIEAAYYDMGNLYVKVNNTYREFITAISPSGQHTFYNGFNVECKKINCFKIIGDEISEELLVELLPKDDENTIAW